MVLLNFSEFIGRLHPVLVHLPIGILLLVALFYVFAKNDIRASQYRLINIALLCGMLGALAAVISGFLLSKNDDYDPGLISRHQWSGIATAGVAIAAYLMHRKSHPYLRWVMSLLILLITLTGHLGGSITHGSDYLTAPLNSETSATTTFTPIANVQEAAVYNEIIKPILSAKCYSCHGPNKQKGKLRLDAPDFILKGGKEGKVIVPGQTEHSGLLQRIALPVRDEDHMPPKEKPQLTKQEMDLLHWWVGAGADFNKKVKETNVTDNIRPVLAWLQSGERASETKTGISDVPATATDAASPEDIKALQDRGVAIVPVARDNHYLSANFVAVDKVGLKDIEILENLKEQLIWLKLSDANINDTQLENISKLKHLTRLYVDGNDIGDSGVGKLKALTALQYLNVSGTNVSLKGLQQLAGLKKLRQIYLYQTPFTRPEFVQLKKIFPQAVIDTGGYRVPTFESDTTRVTEAAKEGN